MQELKYQHYDTSNRLARCTVYIYIYVQTPPFEPPPLSPLQELKYQHYDTSNRLVRSTPLLERLAREKAVAEERAGVAESELEERAARDVGEAAAMEERVGAADAKAAAAAEKAAAAEYQHYDTSNRLARITALLEGVACDKAVAEERAGVAEMRISEVEGKAMRDVEEATARVAAAEERVGAAERRVAEMEEVQEVEEATAAAEKRVGVAEAAVVSATERAVAAEYQHYDTSNRLARCTALLEEMVRENEGLRQRLDTALSASSAMSPDGRAADADAEDADADASSALAQADALKVIA